MRVCLSQDPSRLGHVVVEILARDAPKTWQIRPSSWSRLSPVRRAEPREGRPCQWMRAVTSTSVHPATLDCNPSPQTVAYFAPTAAWFVRLGSIDAIIGGRLRPLSGAIFNVVGGAVRDPRANGAVAGCQIGMAGVE